MIKSRAALKDELLGVLYTMHRFIVILQFFLHFRNDVIPTLPTVTPTRDNCCLQTRRWSNSRTCKALLKRAVWKSAVSSCGAT